MARNSIKLDLQGTKALRQALASLSGGKVRKAMRAALTKGSAPIQKDAKARAPRDSGLLKRSIKKKTKTYPNGTVVAVVGPDRNVYQPASVELGEGENNRVRKTPAKRPANYAHLVEFGTAHSIAKPFLRPAYQANEQAAIKISKDVLGEAILKEAAKAAAKKPK